MVKLKGGDAQEFELIPENDIVNVQLSDVELRTFTWQGDDVEKLKWTFIIKDPGPWQGREIWGDTSTNFTAHPNCRAYNWVAAITGRQYGPSEEFDTDELVGMPCRVLVMHKKDTKVEGRKWMRVREVLPAQGIAASTAVVPPGEAPF